MINKRFVGESKERAHGDVVVQTACLVLATYKVLKSYIKDDEVRSHNLYCLKLSLLFEHQ